MSDRICRIGDCGKPVKSSGLCSMHASRLRRHGDPFVVIHQRDRNFPRGERHHSWTGPVPTYEVTHRRVKAARGPASGYACADCGARARHWSYDHSDPDELLSDDGRAYSPDAAHYVPRCVRCHKRYDCAILIEERGTLSTAPRCGKPMRSRNGAAAQSDDGVVRVCGRVQEHTGYCSSAETYRRSLERGRVAGREGSPTRDDAADPKPRCGEQLQLYRGQVGTCDRPAGHSGQHIGVDAYRRLLDRNSGSAA